MKLGPVGIAFLFCYVLLCLFYCIQIQKQENNSICQLICNFLLLPDDIIEMHDNIINTMSRRGKLLREKSVS